MRVRVKTHDLARELSASEGVIDPKTTIPVLANVLMTAVGDKLELVASNMDVSVSTSCPAKVDGEGTAALPLRPLAQYARLLEPGKEVTISVSASDVGTLTCGDASTRFKGMGAWNYPAVTPMPEEVAVSIPPEVIQTAIRQVLVSIASDSGGRSAVYSSVKLEIAPGRMLLVSTDGSRLSICETSLEGRPVRHEVNCLVPRKALVNIPKIIRRSAGDDDNRPEIEIAVQDKRAFFRTGARTLATRLTVGTFPDYQRVLAKSASHTTEVDRTQLREKLKRVAQFVPGDSAFFAFEIDGDELKLHARDLASGEGKDSLRVSGDTGDFRAGFSAKFILEFLDACSAERFKVEMNDPKRPVELTAGWDNGNQTVRYVVMPLLGP